MKTKKDNSVDQYIAECPKNVQDKLHEIRVTIQKVATTATERMDYFEMPGYSYDGYDYNGMFVWFSYKKPYVRLHIRPPVLQVHEKEVSKYPTTKSIVSFSENEKIPIRLVKKLVSASIAVMKNKENN